MESKINGLDLFSGIGGLTLALDEWVSPIAYCENNKFAQSILLSRMQDGLLPRAPIWDDVKTLDGKQFKGKIDIIFGGFPCQDISIAGNGAGLGGERSGLFFEVMRLAQEIEPTFLFFENVPAIKSRGLEQVAEWVTALGYDCRWDIFSAQEIGAPHKRERWFMLAYSDRNRNRVKKSKGSRIPKKIPSLNREKNRPAGKFGGASRSKRRNPLRRHGESEIFKKEFWKVEPALGRMVDGLPDQLDRIKALGNAVVPLQAKTAFEKLIGVK